MSQNLDKLLIQLINLYPKCIDLSLERLLKLLEKLGNPHLKIPPVIHIAGTNGKGSTLSYILHILKENNFLVNAYISPHLNSFNERIILNNKEVRTNELFINLQYVKKINANKPITFFEITTATAFYLFSKVKADFLLLETGLGGRLDATNVIKESLIDIITPIGIDHQEFLGKNILKITDEKLGIIKKNSYIIISKQKKQIKLYIKNKIKNRKNKKIFFNDQFKIIEKNKKTFTLEFKKQRFKFKKPLLIGDHQVENLSTAVATILQLNEIGFSFSQKIINSGIIKTKWPGRLEKGELKNIPVYLDGAHNIDGAIQLSKFFLKQKNKVWLIFGMLNNKEIFFYLKKLKPILKGVIAISIPNQKNSFTPEEIFKVCEELKINCFKKSSVTKANSFLLSKIKPNTILISGSLYLVGKIRKHYL